MLPASVVRRPRATTKDARVYSTVSQRQFAWSIQWRIKPCGRVDQSAAVDEALTDETETLLPTKTRRSTRPFYSLHDSITALRSSISTATTRHAGQQQSTLLAVKKRVICWIKINNEFVNICQLKKLSLNTSHEWDENITAQAKPNLQMHGALCYNKTITWPLPFLHIHLLLINRRRTSLIN